MKSKQVKSPAVWSGLAGVVLALSSMSAAAGDGDRVRLECSAEGAGDISMDARYEERSRRGATRKRFSTEFEAAPGGRFAPGQIMVVRLKGRNVGRVMLDTARNGDIVGDLNLDSNAGPADTDRPLPRNFPRVKVGSRVVVIIDGRRVLGCRLR